MTKEARILSGENTVSLISGAGKTGLLHVKESSRILRLFPQHPSFAIFLQNNELA